jgi:cell shape-determining protein MreC
VINDPEAMHAAMVSALKTNKELHNKNAHLTSEIERLVKALEQIETCKDDNHSVLQTLGKIAEQALQEHRAKMLEGK